MVPTIYSSSGSSFWPLGGYQLPITSAEALLRSKINLTILRHPRALLRAMLPGGRFCGGSYVRSSLMVALDRIDISQTGLILEAGQWLDTKSGCMGRDPIELFVYLHGTSYARAVEVIARHLAILSDTVCSEETPGWKQELQPVSGHFPEVSDRYFNGAFYRNEAGNVFGVMTRAYAPTNDEFIPVFHTLWRHSRTGRTVRLEAYPAKPYALYNLNLISWRPSDLIVIAPDEFTADLWQHSRSDVVFSAIPGGMDNILDTDFTCLAGRRVLLCLRPSDLIRGLLIEKKLKTSAVAEVTFTLGDDRVLPFSQLPEVAAQQEVQLLPVAKAAESSAGVVGLGEFLDAKLPPRPFVLGPIIPEKGLVLLHAPRGVGKTHVALGIAVACATGKSFLRWAAPKPLKVLVVDGEMARRDLVDRMEMLIPDDDAMLARQNIRLFVTDQPDQCDPIPDIGTEEGRKAIDDRLGDATLLILDNLATLCRSGNENAGDSWPGIQAWLVKLRQRGVSAVLVHHSGKNGGQRGSSRHEDVMNTIIDLRRPADYQASEGARFEVHFTKGRNLVGEDAESFEARLSTDSGKAVWTISKVVGDALEEQACLLFEQGKTVREVASELGISKSAAGRLRKKLIDDGWLGSEPDSDDPST